MVCGQPNTRLRKRRWHCPRLGSPKVTAANRGALGGNIDATNIACISVAPDADRGCDDTGLPCACRPYWTTTNIEGNSHRQPIYCCRERGEHHPRTLRAVLAVTENLKGDAPFRQ